MFQILGTKKQGKISDFKEHQIFEKEKKTTGKSRIRKGLIDEAKQKKNYDPHFLLLCLFVFIETTAATTTKTTLATTTAAATTTAT
jgi:hypothetical protein